MIEDGAILDRGDDVILTGSPSSRLEVPLPCDSECRSAKPCRATWTASSRSASPRAGRPPSAPSSAPTTPTGSATSWERSWRSRADGCCVALLDDEPAGLLLARVVGPGPFTDLVSLDIEAVYVLPAARRRGLGHALLVGATTVADEAGATELYSSPLPGARGMQRFLARLGFAPAASHRVVTTAALQRKLTHEHGHVGADRCAARARAARGPHRPASAGPRRAPARRRGAGGARAGVRRGSGPRRRSPCRSAARCRAAGRPRPRPPPGRSPGARRGAGPSRCPVTTPERAERWCVALSSMPTAARPSPACAIAAIEPSVSARTADAPPCSRP